MYTAEGMYAEAHKIARSFMDEKEVERTYVAQAKQLESDGKLKEAEGLYVTVNQPDLAISMYRRHRQFDAMVRLVAAHRHDHLVSKGAFIRYSIG
jgi:intraflagellar transport protein 172